MFHLTTFPTECFSSEQNSLLIKEALKNYVKIPMVNLFLETFKSFLHALKEPKYSFKTFHSWLQVAKMMFLKDFLLLGTKIPLYVL